MWTGVRVGKRKGMWIRCKALKGKERRTAVINNSDFPIHNFQVFKFIILLAHQ
jgi:hypothetical protein